MEFSGLSRKFATSHSTISCPATRRVRHLLSVFSHRARTLICGTPPRQKPPATCAICFRTKSSPLFADIDRSTIRWTTVESKRTARRTNTRRPPLIEQITPHTFDSTQSLKCQDPATVHVWSRLDLRCGSPAQAQRYFQP